MLVDLSSLTLSVRSIEPWRQVCLVKTTTRTGFEDFTEGRGENALGYVLGKTDVWATSQWTIY
jgi:hypothetical protein